MTKQEIRKEYLAKRTALHNRGELSAQITSTFFQNFDSSLFNTYHVFLSIRKFHEINTEAIIDNLLSQGKTVVVPKTLSGGELHHIVIDEQTEFATNSWGIKEPIDGFRLEPSEVDIVLVPLLVCDHHGYRLGYGKGFYDRFLPYCQENCPKVGLNYFAPLPDSLPINENDFPLTHCVSPDGVHKFS